MELGELLCWGTVPADTFTFQDLLARSHTVSWLVNTKDNHQSIFYFKPNQRLGEIIALGFARSQGGVMPGLLMIQIHLPDRFLCVSKQC